MQRPSGERAVSLLAPMVATGDKIDVTGAEKTAREERALEVLGKAAKRDKKDGRSRFLLAMMHLYRFGQMIERYEDADDTARAEITAAHEGFEAAMPLLWDRATSRGDSRVPGFAAATAFGLGVVTNDPTLRAQGLADLEYAVTVNEFFNIFDFIPVVQATPPSRVNRTTPALVPPGSSSRPTAQPV